jgi:hypothetical protein
MGGGGASRSFPITRARACARGVPTFHGPGARRKQAPRPDTFSGGGGAVADPHSSASLARACAGARRRPHGWAPPLPGPDPTNAFAGWVPPHPLVRVRARAREEELGLSLARGHSGSSSPHRTSTLARVASPSSRRGPGLGLPERSGGRGPSARAARPHRQALRHPHVSQARVRVRPPALAAGGRRAAAYRPHDHGLPDRRARAGWLRKARAEPRRPAGVRAHAYGGRKEGANPRRAGRRRPGAGVLRTSLGARAAGAPPLLARLIS